MAQFKTKHIVRALDHVGNAICPGSAIPILLAARIVAGGGKFELAATDLDLCIEAGGPADGDLAATMLLDPANLRAAIGHGAETVEITDDGVVQSGGLRLTPGSTLPAAEHPAGPKVTGEPTFQASSLAPGSWQIIRRVSGAMSAETTRYYLNGVCLRQKGDAYVAVATDGHRLHCSGLPIDGAEGALDTIIVPRKTVHALLRLAPRGRNVAFSVYPVAESSPVVRFEFARGDLSVRITSKTIDGTFPDYERVIPKDLPHVATFASHDLHRAIGAVRAVATNGRRWGRCVKIEFSPEAATFSTTKWGEEGIIAMKIPYAGAVPPASFGVNGDYLVTAISALPGKMLTLSFAGEGDAPFMIGNGSDFRTVLMPMRL